MIKIFDTKASYDAASKSQAESDISLVKANNTAYVDGTNVCISQPKVGDIQIQKDDSSISYISLDTYKSGAFPSGWTTLGVVAARSGNKVIVVPKIANDGERSLKWMDVYIYVVTGYVLDGASHTASINLQGSGALDFTYTASDTATFVAALKQFIANAGKSSDFSAYLHTDGRVMLQWDTYNASPSTSATGLTLTPKVALDYSTIYELPMRKCGTIGEGVWNFESAVQYFKNDNQSTSYNPATDVTAIPSYPVCKPGYLGTSQYQSDHCAWLRAKYGEGEDGWYAYMHDLEFAEDSPFAAGKEELRYGDKATETLGDVTYTASDGSTKYLYPAFHYCKSIGCHMATAWEFERIAKSWKLDYSDAVNRSYYAVCGQHLPPNSFWWLCGRNSVASSFIAVNIGYVDGSDFFYRFLVLALSLSEI